MTTYGLVCPFLTDDPTFAYGVEFGLLFARMRGEEEYIADYFCLDNQDRILLLASRLGWTIRSMKLWDEGWFWCEMEKGPTSVH
jgi:hypothetical protein